MYGIIYQKRPQLVHLSLLLSIVSYLTIYQLSISFQIIILIYLFQGIRQCFRYVNLYVSLHLPVTVSSLLCAIILITDVYVGLPYNTIKYNFVVELWLHQSSVIA